MLEDEAGNIWCGERAGGVCRFDAASGKFVKVNGDGCFSYQIMDIKEDKAGNIWFANLYTGLCRYDGKNFTHFTKENGLCNDTITCLYEDKKGNLWLGCGSSKFVSGSGGLCRYDGKTFSPFGKIESPGSRDVWCIVEDNDGNMWVGTRGGLFRYHSPSGRFIEYTHKLGSSN
jgi:ligand-binding sensor domain-containing protein